MLRNSISIIIPVYNLPEKTEKCLESIIPTLSLGDQVIVVDNGSEQETKNIYKRYRKKKFFKVIYNKDNGGFSKANNQGINAAVKNNDILLLNNDTYVEQNDWLNILSSRLYGLYKCGIIAPRQYNPENKRFVSCGSYHLPDLFGFNYAGGELNINQFNFERKLKLNNFGAVLIRRTAMREPFLDESVFAYTEDDRACIDMVNDGWNIYYTPFVTIMHTPNSTCKDVNNKLNLSDIHVKSHESFVKQYGSYVMRQKEMSVNMYSLLVRPPGYANAAKTLIRSLEDNNVDVRYEYLYGTEFMEQSTKDPYLFQVQKGKHIRPYDLDNPSIIFQMADMFNHAYSRKLRIGYTMLEIEGLPFTWVDGCNSVDEVWVADTFNKKTFEDAGVTKNIEVMPLGIDTDYFHKDISPIDLSFQSGVNFLIVGEWGKRKNMDMAIRCFKKAFQNGEDVCLWIKTHHAGDAKNDPEAILRHYVSQYNVFGRAPVCVVVSRAHDTKDPNSSKFLPYYRMGSLYRAFDMYVNLSYGEGSDLPSKEALACGIPVMRNGFSAKDFLVNEQGNPHDGVLLTDYELIYPGEKQECPYYTIPEARWGAVKEDDVIDKFKYAYTNIDLMKQYAQQTSSIIATKYSSKICALRIKNRLKEMT